MVEPIMYFTIGLLISALIGLGFLPLVHNRAVRLTTKRLEAATPVSMAEIQAEKDHLRAEFAMSTRRLEMNVEQLKAKTTTQLAELGKKSDIINRMKYELGEKNAAIFQLEARERSVQETLKANEADFAAKTQQLREAEQRLAAKQAELARLTDELSSRSQLADARQSELAAVNAQVSSLQQRVTEAEREFTNSRDRLTLQQSESTQATQDLQTARTENGGLSQRVSELEARLASQTREAEALAARAAELESRLAAQAKMLVERGAENQQLRQQLEALQRQPGGADATGLDRLRQEKSALEKQLAAAMDERGQAQQELTAVRQQHEASWASERMENAVLRERINDVAAEVAKLAMTLEGPESPIKTLLAAETPADPKGAASNPANANQPVRAASAASGKGTLADRIRALQNQSSRAQQG